jgi:hypothetical protein
MLGGAGVDATLMAGMGNVWFSFFRIVALAFLVPLFYAEWNGHRAESSQYSSE